VGVADDAAELASAGEPVGGEEPAFGGVGIHESCGHGADEFAGSEGERVSPEFVEVPKFSDSINSGRWQLTNVVVYDIVPR